MVRKPKNIISLMVGEGKTLSEREIEELKKQKEKTSKDK